MREGGSRRGASGAARRIGEAVSSCALREPLGSRVSEVERAVSMDRRGWLMLLLGLRGEKGLVGLDPVRIQKAMFLFSRLVPSEEAYPFAPYHYGPYSFEL